METMRPAAYWFQLVCKHLLCVHGHVIVMGSIILSSWVESGRQWGWNNVAILPVKGRGCLRKGYERTAEVWGAERDIRMALLRYWIQLGLKQLCHWTSQYMNQFILHPTLFFCFVLFCPVFWASLSWFLSLRTKSILSKPGYQAKVRIWLGQHHKVI